MKTFELTLAGFDPETDKTDSLVYWVKAPNIKAVMCFTDKTGLKLYELPRYMKGRDQQIDESECDFVLDERGTVVSMARLPGRPQSGVQIALCVLGALQSPPNRRLRTSLLRQLGLTHDDIVAAIADLYDKYAATTH